MGLLQVQCRIRSIAQHNLHPRAPEEFLVFVKPRPVVEIAHHHKGFARRQMLNGAGSDPQAFGQLLAAVVDGDAGEGGLVGDPVRGFRFGMDADQTQRRAAPWRHQQFQRWFRQADQVGKSIGIKIIAKGLVKACIAVPALRAGDDALWIVLHLQPVGIKEKGNLLLAVRGKAGHGPALTQTIGAGKVFERAGGGTGAALIGGLDHQNAIGIERGKDDAERCQLIGARDAVAGRAAAILQKMAAVIEQGVEPFDIVGGQPQAHAARRSEISFQAAFSAISRCSASRSASTGTPRATIRSGWLSLTACRQTARITASAASGSTPST